MIKNTFDPDIKEKVEALDQQIKSYKGTIIAFSGGIDSSLLLFLSRKMIGKERTIGVISNSESLKSKDMDLALEFCSLYDIKLEVIKTREIEDIRYNSNPSDRCFFCKTHLYNAINEVQKKYPGFVVLNGTNVDDFGDYRPGLEAAKENNVVSPLADCKISKDDIRTIAKAFDLMNWDKPASPCLSSRVPYNQSITVEKLKQIEHAEAYLNELGFDDVRVRHYGDSCKIEVKPESIAILKGMENKVFTQMKSLGFNKCLIDDEGLVSGKLNRVLKL